MSREELAVFGYIRSNMITDKSPNELLNFVSLWFSLTDSWDIDHTDRHIAVDNAYIIDKSNNVDKKRAIERKIQWDTGLYHVFGTDVISRGQTKTWQIQITKKDEDRRKPYVLMGIMEEKLKLEKHKRIEGFVQNNGYCMYTASGRKYHKRISGLPFDYGQKHDFKVGDIISVELDMTRKMNVSDNNCGVLKFIINHKYEEEKNHIAFDDIDINKQWILSVGLYFKDAVCLLKS
eukprot:124810_1